jgi:hypothetical protein
MERRWINHIHAARSSNGGRWHFPNAIRKYGKDAFSHEVLAMSWDLDGANATEAAIIQQYDTTNPTKGFNITKGGTHFPCIDLRSISEKLSEATKRSMTEEYRQKLSDATRRNATPVRRAYLSSLRIGKLLSQETRKKISESAKKNHDKIACSNRSRGREYFVRMNKIGQQKRVKRPQSQYKICHIHGLLGLEDCYLFMMKSGYMKKFCKKCSIRRRTERKRKVRQIHNDNRVSI